MNLSYTGFQNKKSYNWYYILINSYNIYQLLKITLNLIRKTIKTQIISINEFFKKVITMKNIIIKHRELLFEFGIFFLFFFFTEIKNWGEGGRGGCIYAIPVVRNTSPVQPFLFFCINLLENVFDLILKENVQEFIINFFLR